jgi:hypothetical protein
VGLYVTVFKRKGYVHLHDLAVLTTVLFVYLSCMTAHVRISRSSLAAILPDWESENLRVVYSKKNVRTEKRKHFLYSAGFGNQAANY